MTGTTAPFGEMTMTNLTLTIDLLKSKGACQTALNGLETTHGRAATFCKPSALARALQASGEVSWFAANMLTNTLRAEYDHQCDPIWAEYDRQRATIVATLYFEQVSGMNRRPS